MILGAPTTNHHPTNPAKVNAMKIPTITHNRVDRKTRSKKILRGEGLSGKREEATLSVDTGGNTGPGGIVPPVGRLLDPSAAGLGLVVEDFTGVSKVVRAVESLVAVLLLNTLAS